jgi:hypothetical protein
MCLNRRHYSQQPINQLIMAACCGRWSVPGWRHPIFGSSPARLDHARINFLGLASRSSLYFASPQETISYAVDKSEQGRPSFSGSCARCGAYQSAGWASFRARQNDPRSLLCIFQAIDLFLGYEISYHGVHQFWRQLFVAVSNLQ